MPTLRLCPPPVSAITRELEVGRVQAAAGAVDAAVARALHYEGVLGAAALVRLVDAQAPGDDLEQAGAGAAAVGVGAEARAAAVAHHPARVEDRSLVALAVRAPAGRIVGPAGEALVEDDPLRVRGVELGDRVVDREAGVAAQDAADVDRGIPLLVHRLAAGAGQQAHAGRQPGAGAVRQRLAEVGHVAGVGGEPPALAGEQPGLERVEAHAPAPRRPGALVQHDHPGEPLAVVVRDEHLEAGVRLVAVRVAADRAERRHPGPLEEPEGARVRAVLVAERAAVARVARRMPGRPRAPAALDRVAVVHPLRAERSAVRRGGARAVDRVGRGGRRQRGRRDR